VKALSRYVSHLAPGVVSRIAYRAGADTVGKVVTLVITVAAARALTRDAFGLFALAVTTGWLLGVASDAGLPLHLARAAARYGSAVRPIAAAVIRLRLAFAAAAFAAGSMLGWLWAPPGTRTAFALLVLAQILGATLETLGHLFRGLDRSELEAHVHLAQRLATGVAALTVLAASPTLWPLALALAIPPAAALMVLGAMAGRITSDKVPEVPKVPGVPNVPEVLRSRAGTLGTLREFAPIGIGVLLSSLYFRIDVYFLEFWRGLEEVAGYNAVFRLVEATRLIPAAVLAVTFPSMCRARDLSFLGAVAGPLAAGGFVLMAGVAALAPWLIGVLYGWTYVDAAPALRVLAMALPLFFLNYALTHQVIGWEGQRAYVTVTAGALATNIGANVALVPRYGMLGAATATVVTEIVVTIGCAWALAAAQRARGATPAGAPAGGRV
jgi:O-antigen/teichoic acid export membrane protein